MFLLHPAIEPWAVADAAGLDLVLLCDTELPAGRAFVRTLPDNEELLTPMRADGRDGALWRWRAHVAWDGGNALTLYAFVVARSQAEGGHCWLAADGQHESLPSEALHFRVHPTERPPGWVAEQVFYQVFPDRFARGQGEPAGEHAAWGSPIDKRRAASTFYGGSLTGLVERLPYLHEELGVSALYLNPVFASRSNHRYDTRDYGEVDARLGGNAALLALREATRSRGMKLVLDAVVNHTGADHAWLVDEPGHYARGADGRVLGWKGHASLPVLDFAVPAVQQAIYGAPDAVLRRWLRPPYSIDGWRLDVVHMLGEGPGARHNAQHVRAIRQAIRSENPGAYVLGEHFAEATRWLQGDQEDGAMNYHGFTWPLRGWLAGLELAGQRSPLSTRTLEAWMRRAAASIPQANLAAQFNLLGSHDTPRMLTELGGDLARMKLALTMLFTRPGTPCLYYGDEIGLQGGTDPDCRRCFDWDRSHWQPGLLQHVQGLIRGRKSRAEWQRGATLTLAQDEDWLAYARYTASAATLVVLNRGGPTDVALPVRRLPLSAAGWEGAGGVVVCGESAGTLTLRVPACSASFLLSG